MLRGMVFMDHMNFEISLQDYYKSMGLQTPRLDYAKLFQNIVKRKNDIDFLKAFIFAPKPDDFLMEDEKYFKYHKWVDGLSSMKYIDVVHGRYVSRPVSDTKMKNISDPESYYKVEKGTDINLAIHAISKAHFNSYDVAFVMSCDTDYITVYQQLKNIGKVVILVAVQEQYFGKITKEVDDYIVLDKDFFDLCLR